MPNACPACDTLLPADSSRCFACGRVQGEENRCPSCHAIAGVVAVSGGYVCAACRKPREIGSGQVVLEAPSIGGHSGFKARPSSALRALGIAMISVGLVGAALSWALLPGLTGAVVAAAVGGAGALLGAASIRAAARRALAHQVSLSRGRERQLLDLAEAEGGDLTVTKAARALGVSMSEADEALTAMADGSRVSVEVDPEGVIHYVFRELGLPSSPVRESQPADPGVRVRAPEVDVRDPEGEEIDATDDSDQASARST